ncbi:sulfur oxidation c-type cytochrome SoxA [Terrarubrum flagellatum]|uniref:sulfur oxidation c-type cytochrome SoxA n=1 Tax=Terrirubrum flagellatum TaxID=2895980 RepID=UPI0031451F2E
MHRAQAPILFAALVLAGAGFAQQAGDSRRSGYDMMQPSLQEMERDDGTNPAMLWVREGKSLWSQKLGPDAKSCADCHGDATQTMRGAAARYPAFDAAAQKPIDLAGRIQQCRTERQHATPLARESRGLNALASYVSLQSRGLAITPPQDARLDATRAQGAALFNARMGQLNLSCAACHDANAGQKLGGSLIPQAHPTGYPIYRLEWQDIGSLQRRLRNCMIGVRAEPFPSGSAEYIALEAYLMQRAAGMAMDAPGVRP